MASVINPIPTAASGALQILPFANHPPTANLEPSAGLIDAGYAPAPDAPDYRNANYILNQQSALNSRGIQTALFIENALGEVIIGANFGVGKDRRITINGHNLDDTGANLDDATIVASRYVAAINSNVLVNTAVQATVNGFGFVRIESLMPGVLFTLAAIPLAGGAGCAVLFAPTQPSIRTDVTGVGTAASGDPQMLDVVFGSISLEDGTPAGRGRLQFRKAKAAFSVGEFTGTQADDANTGDDSMRLGLNAKASGARSFSAGGSGSQSRAADALAMMGAIAHGTEDIAIGVGADANRGAGLEALAIGSLAHAGVAGVAIGVQNDALGGGATAVGNANTASGADSVSLGSGTTASADAAIAIGDGANAESANSIAIGESCDSKTGTTAISIGKSITTTGHGALGTGITAGLATVNADGRGARAHGAPQTAPVCALSEGSDAMGDGCRAAGAFSHASGAGADAPNRGEFARSSLGPALTDNGKHQHGNLILQANTTDAATAVKFCTDKIDGTGAEWNPANSRGYVVRYRCVAKKFLTAGVAIWEGTFLAVNNGGTLTVPVDGKNISGGAFTRTAAFPNAPDIESGLATPTIQISVAGGVIRFEAIGGAAATNIRYTLSLHYAQAGIA